MASRALKYVPAPAGLRDVILAEYDAYKAWRGAGVPDELLSTFWASSGTGVPSHDASKAIDIITDGLASRPYLFEFGVWLFSKRPDLSVYFYPTTYEPHVHVGEVSGFGKGSFLAINSGAKGKFEIYPRDKVAGDAERILAGLQKTRATYPAGVDVRWDDVESWLTGKSAPAGSGWLSLLKKYWWIGGISVLLLVVVLIYKKAKEGNEYGT